MYESECLQHMNQNGCTLQTPLICDGKIHRFSRDSKQNQPDEWYVAFSGSFPSGQPYLCCIYGSWSDAAKYEYKSWENSNRSYTATDSKSMQFKMEEYRRMAALEQHQHHEEAAKKAKKIWESSKSDGTHPYLTKKQVQAHGIRFGHNHSLIIPLKNNEGEVRSLQFIYEDNGKFTKRFLRGGEKQGNFHLIGEIRPDSLICIGEGFATGASWHQATSHPTAIAFDSGNLSAVARVLRSVYPTHQSLIIGDDDVEAKINVGRKKAIEAAESNNCLVIFPQFPKGSRDSEGKAFTDFNDLHLSHGMEEIQVQLKALLSKEKQLPLLEPLQNQNKEKDTSHLSVAQKVIDALGRENLLEGLGKIWKWNGAGLWEPIDDRIIKKKIHEKMESKKITKFSVNSILDVIKTEIFVGNHRFNFDVRSINCLNGELHYREGKWLLEPHERKNYRSTQIPIAFDPEAKAPRFEQFLDEVFSGDTDAKEKKKVVCELFGYSLLTSCEFEKFVILVGNGANGKSVLLNVLESLVGNSNVSAVQPSQFDNRFQRGHLFGKLVNLVTEIPEGAEMADAALKAIVSGERTTAEQKHKDPFDFHPFCTCWFGTNHLPYCRDFSDAIFRRTIILSFNKKFEGETRDVHLSNKLKQELPGILNLALDGIAGVFRRSEFTLCPSSEKAKQGWRFECDQVEQFVADCCDIGPTLKETSRDIFQAYTSWARQVGMKGILGQNKLTQRLQKMGVMSCRGTKGKRMLSGIGIRLDGDDTSDAELPNNFYATEQKDRDKRM